MERALRTVTVAAACSLLLACGGGSGGPVQPPPPTDPPAAPTGLSAAPGTAELDLTWSAVAGATGYHVYRATSAGGTYARLTSQPVAGAAYVDGAVTAGATYWYQVTALNAAGESDPSAAASATAPGTPPQPGSCLGQALMTALGRTRFMVGFTGGDATADAAPFDVRYQYLAGEIQDPNQPCANWNWWGCWWSDLTTPPGANFPSGYVAAAQGRGEIPMFTYYLILYAAGWNEGAGEVTAANDVAAMTRYLGDWRFFLTKLGSAQALLQIEPDFWAYAQQRNADPHAIPAAVASTGLADCQGYENSIAGLGQCMVHMARLHAPNAKVGLHASAWSTNYDVIYNTDPGFDVAGEARKTAAFLAEAGGAQADFLTVEMCDRDAGFKGCWWDATNATLPNFHQDQAWASALAEAAGKPLLWWQVPVGNMSQADTTDHYRDNRVQYFFDHPAEFAAAHGVGIAFGAGATGQTTPETDGGYLVGRTNTYATAGGTPACP